MISTQATLLVLLAASAAGELLVTLRPAWRFRRPLALASLLVLSFACAGLLAVDPDLWTVGAAVAGAYRAVNLARLLEGRMHEQFVRHAARRTALWLIAAQSLLLAAASYFGDAGLPAHVLLTAVAAAQLAAAVLLAGSTGRQLRKTAPEHQTASLADGKLPGITVAIPARNEDALLEDCLTSVLASDYPKLEVIVLDDCSADRTPDIIRSFAHSGVRFVRGSEPSDGWLAKNQAYDRLTAEASGSLILFCGVDVRLQRKSLRQLVAVMQARGKSMVSVMPLNPRPERLPVLQAMRYCWEMCLPRRQLSRPPVLSSCWLADRGMLQRTGGFAAFRRSVTPEAHFARAAARTDGYAFIRADAWLGITSEKPPAEQFDTAVQTRYPQLHRRPELVLAVAAAETVLCLAPLPVALWSAATLHLVPLLLSVAAAVLLARTFVRLQRSVFPGVPAGRVVGSLVPALLRDIQLLHLSMYRYEFSQVYWRGRNICYPVMRIDPPAPRR